MEDTQKNFSFDLSILLSLIFLFFNCAFAQVSSTFYTDIEWWLVTGDNGAAWEATTGNPGGCLSVNDLAVGNMNYIIAPTKYHGNWSGMSVADSISAQIFYNNIGGGYEVYPEYIFRISGPGGAAHTMSGQTFHPVKGTWTTYTAYIDPCDWTIESGNWNDIICNIKWYQNNGRILQRFRDGTAG
ncbi:MAG: hypothetical protein A2Y12_16430 [Planctomycetes bacterium GWF2_42_9]|nr:MAG: hypothetical protein A2Y12_16430 [Planctomycetes bacterium GWF2_42_9]